ncbi:MAG: cupin domain-containing protein [Calditrichaeota bacterium]|nr:MAG: cupin domain-containing protein [Calditrichota bacterium]
MNNELWSVNTNEKDWRPLPDSNKVFYKSLRFDKETTALSILLKFEAGGSAPLHKHPKGEEYFVLKGSIEEGGKTYHEGEYVYYPPESIHKPMSKAGCEILVILPQAIEVLEK